MKTATVKPSDLIREDAWRCASCGKPAPNRLRTCEGCPTGCVYQHTAAGSASVWAVEPEALAKERLAAAAPAMLAALHEAEEVLTQYEDADHDGAGFVPNSAMRARMEVSAAIAKAEGRE